MRHVCLLILVLCGCTQGKIYSSTMGTDLDTSSDVDTALGDVIDGVDDEDGVPDDDEDGVPDDDEDGVHDDDGDGFNAANDCDDDDPDVNPDAEEICDGIDNNCDGQVDEGVSTVVHADLDGDGFGDPETVEAVCEVPSGMVEDGTDCDDTDPTVFPGAEETCDALDNNCDGVVDEDLPTAVWYRDDDGDGHGLVDERVEACAAPDGYVGQHGDCDDYNAAVNPDAVEVCNGIDDDCDTLIDEGATTRFYQDLDGDGFGDDDVVQDACEVPPDYVATPGDCDDLDGSIHPDAPELCNDVDDDCDGVVDDDVDLLTWYRDSDGDGYGTDAETIEACDETSGYVAGSGDCDDGDAYIHPGAPERCDDVDNDCDGIVDEDGPEVWFADADGDGYGDPDSTTTGCDPPAGFVDNDDDCDDEDPRVSPWAYEVCNGIDDDCDGLVDEAAAVDADTWYVDADGDGFGDASESTRACDAPEGTSIEAGDCDDADDGIHPEADEICDGLDNDCDDATDEDDPSLTDGTTWIIDADSDGYGSDAYSMVACAARDGWVAPGGPEDCDDLVAAVHPDATEVCNGVDDDCDGEIDGASAVDPSVWYLDADGDGFGVRDSVMRDCDVPSGYTDRDDDCDDDDRAVHPDAIETCNGVDDDCDGEIDPGWLDSDEDGVANCVDESVYSEDFSSGWGHWSIIDLMGVSAHDWWGWEPPEWEIVDGRLFEATNLSDSVAHSPDLGELDAFSVSVWISVTPGANNAAGIAFGVQDTDNLFVLQWMDPTGYYGWYSPASHVRLVQAVDGEWSVIAESSSTADLSEPPWSRTEFTVHVDADRITATKDGSIVLNHAFTGALPIGPYSVGVWTWDNDGGVYFDDVEVTNP